MSREIAIELLRNCDKLIRYHPNVRKAIELLESEPAGEFTKRARDYYKNIDSQTPFLLEACDRIDRLEAELKAKDELLKKSRDYIRTQNHVGKAQMQFIKEVEHDLKGNDAR